MARRWNEEEENIYRKQLIDLYVKKNKTIGEIAILLGVAEQTVFQRLNRLGINTTPHLKKNYLLKPRVVKIPEKYTADLAEFFGVMLGDGHLSHFQVQVSLGNKEIKYARYVCKLMEKVFETKPRICTRKSGYHDVYFGSTIVTAWLYSNGLVSNKVKSQVGVPKWIFSKKEFMNAFLRGFFDTDGSVYKLRFGIQVSFTNHSYPILVSLHKMLFKLRYSSSVINKKVIYLTKKDDLLRFFEEVKPKNPKHVKRFRNFVLMRRSDSGYSSRL